MARLLALLCSLIALTPSIQAQNHDASEVSTKNPPTIYDFEHVGCYTSDALLSLAGDENDGLFTQVEEWEFMTLHQCISDCHHAAFAAVNNRTCYCATDPSAVDDKPPIDEEKCNHPCPNNPTHFCGGGGTSITLSSKDKSAYLTIYRNIHFNPLHLELMARALPLQAPLAPLQPTILPTVISTTFTILCTPPSCASAYASLTATTITALVTRTSPEVLPTVPMSMRKVSWSGRIDDGGFQAVAMDVEVPDVEAIEMMEGKVREWRGKGEEGLEEQAKGRSQEWEEWEGLDLDLGGDMGAEEGIDDGEADDDDDGKRDDLKDAADSIIDMLKSGPVSVRAEAEVKVKRDDSGAHDEYFVNDHEAPFAGIGALGNMHAGHACEGTMGGR